jgi:peptide/nickel transport system substrate-binding protein
MLGWRWWGADGKEASKSRRITLARGGWRALSGTTLVLAALLAPPGPAAADGRKDALVVVDAEGPAMLDIHAPNANVPTRQVSWNIYDRLVTFGRKRLPDSSFTCVYTQIEPELAESWSAAPDGSSITFKLRPGAVFHDGAPVTADDVK